MAKKTIANNTSNFKKGKQGFLKVAKEPLKNATVNLPKSYIKYIEDLVGKSIDSKSACIRNELREFLKEYIKLYKILKDIDISDSTEDP